MISELYDPGVEMEDGSMMRSGLANITPVFGLVFPKPPTPPSNALLCAVGWKKGRDAVDMVVDINNLWNCLLLEDDNDEGVAAVVSGMCLMEDLGS